MKNEVGFVSIKNPRDFDDKVIQKHTESERSNRHLRYVFSLTISKKRTIQREGHIYCIISTLIFCIHVDTLLFADVFISLRVLMC